MIIYLITNLVNGKKYIGKDRRNDPNYFGGGQLIKAAVKKYGKENFRKDILATCKDVNELAEMENKFIIEHDAVNNPEYYNLTYARDGNWDWATWEKAIDSTPNVPNQITFEGKKFKSKNAWAREAKELHDIPRNTALRLLNWGFNTYNEMLAYMGMNKADKYKYRIEKNERC